MNEYIYIYGPLQHTHIQSQRRGERRCYAIATCIAAAVCPQSSYKYDPCITIIPSLYFCLT